MTASRPDVQRGSAYGSTSAGRVPPAKKIEAFRRISLSSSRRRTLVLKALISAGEDRLALDRGGREDVVAVPNERVDGLLGRCPDRVRSQRPPFRRRCAVRPARLGRLVHRRCSPRRWMPYARSESSLTRTTPRATARGPSDRGSAPDRAGSAPGADLQIFAGRSHRPSPVDVGGGTHVAVGDDGEGTDRELGVEWDRPEFEAFIEGGQ